MMKKSLLCLIIPFVCIMCTDESDQNSALVESSQSNFDKKIATTTTPETQPATTNNNTTPSSERKTPSQDTQLVTAPVEEQTPVEEQAPAKTENNKQNRKTPSFGETSYTVDYDKDKHEVSLKLTSTTAIAGLQFDYSATGVEIANKNIPVDGDWALQFGPNKAVGFSMSGKKISQDVDIRIPVKKTGASWAGEVCINGVIAAVTNDQNKVASTKITSGKNCTQTE